LKRSFAAACATVLAALVLPVSSASGAEGRVPVDVRAIDEFILQELRTGSIPGAAVAITHGDEVVHVRGYGHDSDGEPVTPTTLFRVASVSKSITSLAVMQLVDEGLVALDDTLVSHLPEFQPVDARGVEITVRQILDQTSGLADRAIPDMARVQPADLTAATTSLNPARLVAVPGERWNYHNPNYHLAARLVEVVSGESFDAYLERHVFEPAGMTSSLTTTFSDDPVDGLADGHVVAYGHAFALPPPHIFTAGAGGVVADASDMARWLIVNANRGRAADGTRLISKTGLRQLHSSSAPDGYALGWDTYGSASAPRVEHNGNGFTFSAYEAVLPESEYGVALLFISSSALMREQSAMFYGVMGVVDGSDASPDGLAVSGRSLDLFLALLASAALLLGVRGAIRSRQWAGRRMPFRTGTLLRLAPYLALLVLLLWFPRVAGLAMGDRAVSWETAAYGWPALIVLVLGGLIAISLTWVGRAWHLLRGPEPRGQWSDPAWLGSSEG
jgi:CubicO group peptidase (beta-lactamase class C family)